MLTAILVLGLAAATVATIARALVPTLWLLVKPWSCDLCMSWWSSLALSVPLSVHLGLARTDSFFTILGATALSMTVLKVHARLSDIGTPPPSE